MADYDWKSPTPLDEAIAEVNAAMKKLIYYRKMVEQWGETYSEAYSEAAKKLKELL